MYQLSGNQHGGTERGRLNYFENVITDSRNPIPDISEGLNVFLGSYSLMEPLG